MKKQSQHTVIYRFNHITTYFPLQTPLTDNQRRLIAKTLSIPQTTKLLIMGAIRLKEARVPANPKMELYLCFDFTDNSYIIDYDHSKRIGR